MQSDRRVQLAGGVLRWSILAFYSLWLVHPYFEGRLIGTGDAVWYHNVLADAVTQFRAGVFPVYVGQSAYAFNGAIYPIRAAPYFQYFAGFLDLLTSHRLNFFALEHLTAVFSIVTGAFTTYIALIWLAPSHRWSAFALSLLYLSCPGVIGLFYAQDLYMSGMSIPWVPVVFAALVKTSENGRRNPIVVAAGALGVLWWAHSPIAFWTTLSAVVIGITSIGANPWNHAQFKSYLRAILIFAVLAAYPIISVFLLRAPGEAIVPYTMDRELLLRWVAGSFPSSIKPIDLSAPLLSYIQLGYSLWSVLLFCTIACVLWRLGRSIKMSLAVVFFMLILVFPVPWLTHALWNSFPETLVGMTLYWPMQRFYVIIAAAAVVICQCVARDCEYRCVRLMSLVVFTGSLAWSGHEAAKLVSNARKQATTVQESSLLGRSENVAIQRHMYGLFSRRPSYFNHGVVAPELEERLLDPKSFEIIAADYGRTSPSETQVFRGVIDANPGIIDLTPSLQITPNRFYELSFEFIHPATSGLLQLDGHNFIREYALPASGDMKAFGSGPSNSRSIVLWTSNPTATIINLRFIPAGKNAYPATYIPFARYRLRAIDPAQLPVNVESLIPYRAFVNSAKAAILETPRMFVPGYIATVNGAPTGVVKTPEGLVGFPVPAGKSVVELRFIGPPLLRFSFWTSFSAWLIAAAFVCATSVRSLLRQL